MKLLLYCTKAKPYLRDYRGKAIYNRFVISPTDRPFTSDDTQPILNGKIVAECDFEVEKIELQGDEINLFYGIEEKSCLTFEQISNYLGYDNDYKGYAIHIKNLHIFDEPREITDLVLLNQYRKDLDGTQFNKVKVAPQNMSLVDYSVNAVDKYKNYIFDCPYILISIRPEWLCKILNGEKTIEVRKVVLKEMLNNE